MKKKCPVCRKKFTPRTSRSVYCTDKCANRAKKVRDRYGLGPDDVVALYKKQNGRCAICGTKGDVHELGFYDRPVLAIDHDHNSGLVRGLLCSACNLGIGKLADNWKTIYNAYRYVKHHKGE